MLATDDTIAAIATPPGEGGVAIVRISGPEALAIADRVFRCAGAKPSERPTHTIIHGYVTDEGDRDIDEALLLVMRSPQSFTAEDVAEIQCHGGNVVARRILRRVLDAGARMAEPGEFTRRAFLNGRIDLVQAEAVLDLVRAKSDRAAAAALEQLEGSLSRTFARIYDDIIALCADIEAMLDFPDDEIQPVPTSDLRTRLSKLQVAVGDCVRSWDEGRLLRDGALAVISGKVSVGKSTLLNALLGHPRAIVSPIPGTTRDTLEETLVLDGIPIRLVDTAGLREPEGAIEEEGIRRARAHIERADLHLYVIDASQPLHADDRRALAELRDERCVVVLNKVDLGSSVRPSDLPGLSAVETSLLHARGVAEVREAMRSEIEKGLDMGAKPHAVVAERHRCLLLEAGRELAEANEALSAKDEGFVLAAQNLRSAAEAVGRILGKVYDEDVLNAVFSRFCVGK